MSTSKDELFLQFEKHGNDIIQIQVRFVNGEMFFRFNSPIQQPGRKSILWFREVEGLKVNLVESVFLEREFYIELENNATLVFQGFGRFGNIFLKQQIAENALAFRKSARSIQQSSDTDLNVILSETIRSEELRFLSPELKKWLQEKGFDNGDLGAKSACINELLDFVKTAPFYFDENTDPPMLSRLAGPGKTKIGRGIEVLDEYAARFIRRTLFLQKQQQLISAIKKDIVHFNRLQEDNRSKIATIENRRSYKELGDIVMSHAHSIKGGVGTALLTDFYTGNPIRIKLNPDLSAAENAQRFYRKAKNEGKELQMARENLLMAEKKLSELKTELERTATATEFRQLPSKETIKSDKQETATGYRIEIVEGFTFWIGKSAKGNDALLRDSGKNDIWLHARDVAGSHVIIKSSGSRVPQSTLEKAALLAAQSSKAKTQSVVPVIFTERKYVVRPKGAAPGEVRLLKENVIDVFLNT